MRRRRSEQAEETAFVPEARPAPDEPLPDEPLPDEPLPDEPLPDDLADDDLADDEVDGDQPSTVDEPGPSGPARPAGLDERSRQILDFERQWWKHAGAKEQAIRDTFGLSATRYYQLLNSLLDDPAALAHDASTVHRLRRLRASRTRRPA